MTSTREQALVTIEQEIRDSVALSIGGARLLAADIRNALAAAGLLREDEPRIDWDAFDRAAEADVQRAPRGGEDEPERAEETIEQVWVVTGWFGSDEWIVDVYATEEAADARVAELWKTRASENGPEYSRGLHKFGAESWPLLGVVAGREQASQDASPERDGESIDYEAISKKAREAFRFVPLGVPDATTRAVIDAAISWERDQASREQGDG